MHVRRKPEQPALVVCDHASCSIPAELHGLGVSTEQRRTHIGWDIGAAAVARRVARSLGLPLIAANHSRLVIDCNRRLDDPTVFPAISDGMTVPGNQGLRRSERAQRAATYYWPYHHAIRDALRDLESRAPAPALLAIHSFTPAMQGQLRPWHIGVLWDKDSRIAEPLLRGLRAHDGVRVGDNEPYSGRHPADFTLDHHAEAEGRPHVGIEVRQDLLATEEGIEHWSDLLVAALRPVLENPRLYTLRGEAV